MTCNSSHLAVSQSAPRVFIMRTKVTITKACGVLVLISVAFISYKLLLSNNMLDQEPEMFIQKKSDAVKLTAVSVNVGSFKGMFWQTLFYQSTNSVEKIVHTPRTAVYLHQFYYDDRAKHRGYKKVIGYVSSALPKSKLHLFCTFWIERSPSEIVQIGITEAKLVVLKHATYYFRGVEYLPYFLSCNSPFSPDYVSVSFLRPTQSVHSTNITNLLAVISPEVPSKPSHESKTIGICTHGMHGSFRDEDVPLFVQWVELSHMFGASFISLYNVTLMESSHYLNKLIQHYKQKNMLEFIQYPPIPPTRPPYFTSVDVEMAKQTLVRHTVGDCMYRNIHKYWYILYVDLDEIVFPHGGCKNYSNCLTQLLSKHWGWKNQAGLGMTNSYHWYNVPKYADKQYSVDNPVLRYSTRTLDHRGYLNKAFTNPRVCDYLYQHGCWPVPSVSIPPETMMIHHYRISCIRGEMCSRPNPKNTVDSFLASYKDEISKRTQNVLRAINWTSVAGF